MDAAVECTHCKVVMTSWSAAGSQIRYYQCPFCARTHSSLYGEVFRRRAGARVVETPARAAGPAEIPMASVEDIRWAQVKASAAQWFARVQADERACAPRRPPPAPASPPSPPARGIPSARRRSAGAPKGLTAVRWRVALRAARWPSAVT